MCSFLFADLNGADSLPNCSLLYLHSNDMNSFKSVILKGNKDEAVYVSTR